MKGLSAFLFLLIGFGYAHAQSFNLRNDRKVIISVGTGATTYLGDLQDPGDFFDLRPNAVIGLQQVFSERFSARAEFSWFQLEGSDLQDGTEDGGSRNERNLSFKSNTFELNTVGMFHLYKIGRRFYQRPIFNIYGFVGLGLTWFNPTAEYRDETYALQPLMTEGVDYSRMTLAIPMGLGVKLRVNHFFNIAAEMGYRKTFTDYLDDVSTVYVDNESFEDPIAKALADRRPEIFGEGSQWKAGRRRGNPDNDDGYLLWNLKVEYYLPVSGLHELVTGRKSRVRRPRRKGSRRFRRPKRR